MPTLGEMITARAAALGLSDQKVSEVFKVTASTVTRWRQGASPQRDKIPALAAWLEVDQSVVLAAIQADEAVTLTDVMSDLRALAALVAELGERVTALERSRRR